MFGKKDEDGNLIPSEMELVRLAIPRRVYTQSHIDYVIETFEMLMDKKERGRGFRITYEPEFLRHFTAHFERV
jgi:tryptophanase